MKIILDKEFSQKSFGIFSLYSETKNQYFPSIDWDDFFIPIIIDWYKEIRHHEQY